MEHLFKNKSCIDEEELLENISIEQENNNSDEVSIMSLCF